MALQPDPPVAPPIAPSGGGGGGGEVDISPASITDLADAIASQIAGEALTVNATVSNEVEVKNDTGSPVPVVGTVEITNDVGSPIPVSGTVTISDGSGPVTVDGTVAVTGVSTAAAQATGNASLATIDGHVDGIEALLTTIDGRVDGLEGLIGTTNTTLTTIDGRVDGLESAIAALTQAGASVKQLGPITIAGMTNVLYTTGDVIGQVLTFPAAARANGGTGLMVSSLLFDPGLHMGLFDIELHVFNATVSVTDNAAYSVTDAELATWQGWFKWIAGEWIGNGNNSMNMQQGKSIVYACAAGDTALYGVLVARGAVTATSTATDAKVAIGVVRD